SRQHLSWILCSHRGGACAPVAARPGLLLSRPRPHSTRAHPPGRTDPPGRRLPRYLLHRDGNPDRLRSCRHHPAGARLSGKFTPPSGFGAHSELTRVGAAAAPVSAGRVALKALTGNRREPSRASSVMVRPISAANLPACPAPAHTSTRCDPGT